jgi:hypothetical protein
MAGGLGFPFEVGGPLSGSVTNLGKSPSVITKRISCRIQKNHLRSIFLRDRIITF